MTVTVCTVLGFAVLAALSFVIRAIVRRGVATGSIRRLSKEEMNRSGISRWRITRLSKAQQETLGYPERQQPRG